MPDRQPEPITCPDCGKRYRFSAPLAGRKVKCQCGTVMQMPRTPTPAPPSSPPPPPGGDGYELSNEPTPTRATAAAAATCPNCGQKLKHGAVLCINCGTDLHSGQRLNTHVSGDATDADAPAFAAAPPVNPQLGGQLAAASRRKGLDTQALALDIQQQQRWQDLYNPLIVLGAGLALLLLTALVIVPMTPNTSPRFALIFAAIRFAFQVPLIFVAILLVARLFGTSYGTFGVAVLKLIAIVILAAAVDDAVRYGLDALTGGFGAIGGLLQWSVSLGVFVVLAIWLLDMEYLEAFVLYLLMALLPIIVLIFVGGTLMAIFPSP